MKKALLGIIILGICSSTFAQKVQLGLRFNPQVSWFNVENTDVAYIDNDGARVGFSYGLMADISFADNYALSTGLFHNLYSGNTSALALDSTINQFTFEEWSLQYIEIPLHLKMKTNEVNSMIYYGKFGLTPQFKINGEIDNKTAENIGFFNLHLSVGGGIHYIIGGSTAALCGITFHNGFANISQWDEFEVKTSYLSLDLGIIF